MVVDYIVSALLNTGKFLLAGVLSWLAVALVMQLLSNSLRKSLAKIFGHQLYIYLTAPGVVIHESSHALFCLIFRHKILEIKFFSPEANGTLGYVKHSFDPTSLYQRIGNFFIGTAPVWGGSAALWLITRLLLPECMYIDGAVTEAAADFLATGFWKKWSFYLWLYLALTIASHITLSMPDLAGSADGITTILVVSLLGFLLLGWCGNWEEPLICFFTDIFLSSCGILTFVLVLLGILCAGCKVISGRG